MGAALDAGQTQGVASVDLKGANGIRFRAIFWTILAFSPRCADAADEVEPGVESLWQGDRDLAVA